MKTACIGVLFVAVLASGCSSRQAVPGGDIVPQSAPFTRVRDDATIGHFIKHVVVIIQENRSFDNMFNGFPNADTQSYGYADENGKEVKVPLKSRSFTKGDLGDLPHGYAANIVECDPQGSGNSNCKMDGFYAAMQKWPRPGEPATYPYSYLPRTDTAPYWTMAQQYVLADKMYATEWGASFTAHIDLLAANTWLNNQKTLALVDTPSLGPWGCDSPKGTTTPTLDNKLHRNANGPFPCFDRYATLAKLLDNKHLPWHYYAAPPASFGYIYSTFDAIKWVREGNDWNNVISPQTKILTDGSKPLAPVTWVVPTGKDSDHPGQHSDTGPSWVADIVNTIGASSNWKDTAIVVLWDDWGGFYDHVPPPQLDYLGLNFRVPMLVISPYAKKGYVSHTQYEFGSVVKFIENVFTLPSLGFTDKRANGLSDAFDFSQKPRSFQKIPCKYPPSHFLNEPPQNGPLDTDEN